MASSSSKTAGFWTALIFGLLITLAFFGLRYSLNLSILLGAIAAICGYFLGSWWQIRQPPAGPEKSPLEPLQKGVTQVLLKTKLLQPDWGQSAKHPTRALSLFEWMLRPHKIPPRPRK